MIFKEQFTMQLKDIGKENYMKNRAILEIFENIGTHHLILQDMDQMI